MNKWFVAILGLLWGASVHATVILNSDSSSVLTADTQVNASIFSVGDTVFNLNRLNRGILSVQLSNDSKLPAGTSLNEKGVLTVSDPAAMKPGTYELSIKSKIAPEEWYDNYITIKVSNTQFLVHVDSDHIEMATGFRAEGKIYVVVAVALVLFLVIIAFLVRMERNVARMERTQKP